MKFTLSADGMAPVQQGIGSVFKALAQAPVLQQQMQEQAALRNAQTYNSNMSGNKHGAEAAGLQYTLDQRKGIEDLIAQNPQFAQNVQSAMKMWAMTGKGDPNNIANAATEFQTQGIRDKAVANVGDLDQMNRLNTLAKPGATYEPFNNIGNTGTVLNKATGGATVASSTLDKLFGNESRSKTTENYAQAGNANASAERNKASTEFIRTKNMAAQTPGGKPLTSAQLRINAEVEAAREALAGMDEADIESLLKKDSFSLTPGDKNTLGLLKKARSAKYGEPEIPTVSPKPPPPAPPKAPGLPTQVMNWLTGPSSGAKAKSPSAGEAPVKVTSKAQMDALPSGARFIAPDGTTRIKP